MQPDTVFLSIFARDWSAQSNWWTRLIGRGWDREPAPDCHEWQLTGDVLLQVLDGGKKAGSATVTMRVEDLDAERSRLREVDIAVPEPTAVKGFATLRYSEFEDPEGNTVGLLDGR